MTAKNKKRNKWLQSVFLLINFIVIAALALSYLSPVTSPETNVIPAILALFYPVFLILNILFIIWWIVRLRYYFLFSLAVIFAGYNIFFKTFCFNSEKPVGSYNDAMKVLSYNVRLFDQFKWTGNQNYFTRNSIFEFVHSEQADIVCFQEFFHGNEKYFPTIGPFLEKSGTKNYHVDYVLVKGDPNIMTLLPLQSFLLWQKAVSGSRVKLQTRAFTATSFLKVTLFGCSTFTSNR